MSGNDLYNISYDDIEHETNEAVTQPDQLRP